MRIEREEDIVSNLPQLKTMYETVSTLEVGLLEWEARTLTTGPPSPRRVKLNLKTKHRKK